MEQQLALAIQQLSAHINSLKKSEAQPTRSSELKDLFAALAKAQAEMQTAGLSAQNPFFKARYADLAAIVKASRPALTKHGLSIMQQLITDDAGHTLLHTLLGHNSGQWVESRVRIVPPKNDVQSMGSYITYLRRYSIAALCGIVASDEDDDGQMAMASDRDFSKSAASAKYHAHENNTETISADQLATLESELINHADIIELVKDGFKISSLAAMPKNKFAAAMNRIRAIKASK